MKVLMLSIILLLYYLCGWDFLDGSLKLVSFWFSFNPPLLVVFPVKVKSCVLAPELAYVCESHKHKCDSCLMKGRLSLSLSLSVHLD